MPRQTPHRNYDSFGVYSWYTPGIGGLLIFGLVFLAGVLLATLVSGLLLLIGLPQEALQVISYVLMFVPVLIFAAIASRNNALFETGYRLDSAHFAPYRGTLLALLAALAIFCLGLVVDPINSLVMRLYPMPDLWKEALEQLTNGNFALNFLSVCILAPILEEWMCRGIVLRSLLQKVRPLWAVVISALVFALIHGNIWQGFNAFALGLLLGYVYFKTGSLKLTMLMHLTNNLVALLSSQSNTLSQAESWLEIMPVWAYVTMIIAAALILLGCLKIFRELPLISERGNCDPVRPEEDFEL